MTESRLELLLRKAKDRGLTPITITELFPLQDELLQPSPESLFWRKKKEILKKYGYDEESWKEVLVAARTFYFIPTPKMEHCNREMRELAFKYENRTPAWSIDHLYQLATQSVRPKKNKKQHITRTKNEKGTYIYDYQ